MPLIIIRCPHCDADQMTFKLGTIEARNQSSANSWSSCPSCRNPIAILIRQARQGNSATNLATYGGNLTDAGWCVGQVWPPISRPEMPADIPDHIGRNFLQAEEARKRAHMESAGMMYRRSLELSLKNIAPNLTGTLAKRIDKLAGEGRLTNDLAEWAHSVRELGNEATHDDGQPDELDIEDLAALTRVILEYLYTMPAKVARRANIADGEAVEQPSP